MPIKPKLTPEEKKQLKVEKKLEKKRLAELKKIQEQHDHLKREIKLGQLTIKRHEKKWKAMLVTITLPRMRAELELAWHNFERAMDAKDFAISLLLDELQCADEQYQINFRGHVENIDNLITKFKDRLGELKQDAGAQIAAMKGLAEEEITNASENSTEIEECLKVMLHGLEMEKKQHKLLVRGEYLSKIDEEGTRYADIIHGQRVNLERKINKIWDETKKFFGESTERTADRRKAYAVLVQQDNSLQKICAAQYIQLYKMQKYFKKLRQQYVNIQQSGSQKISDLAQERQYFANVFWTLRQRLKADKELDGNNLQILTVESSIAKEHLDKVEKKGERLLELSAVCRKLETAEEKILSFPKCVPHGFTIPEYVDIHQYEVTHNLYLFWRRVAQADAVRHSMNEEKEYLVRQNKILKQKIHRYCECVECPPQNIDHRNVANKDPCKKINVVDGYAVQQNYDRQSSLQF